MTLEQPTLWEVCRSSGNLLSGLSQRAPLQLRRLPGGARGLAVVSAKEKERKGKETHDEKTLMQSGHYFRSTFSSVEGTPPIIATVFIYIHTC